MLFERVAIQNVSPQHPSSANGCQHMFSTCAYSGCLGSPALLLTSGCKYDLDELWLMGCAETRGGSEGTIVAAFPMRV